MKELKCEKCKSTNTYTLQDGTLVCRRCGHRNKKQEKKNDQRKEFLQRQ